MFKPISWGIGSAKAALSGPLAKSAGIGAGIGAGYGLLFGNSMMGGAIAGAGLGAYYGGGKGSLRGAAPWSRSNASPSAGAMHWGTRAAGTGAAIGVGFGGLFGDSWYSPIGYGMLGAGLGGGAGAGVGWGAMTNNKVSGVLSDAMRAKRFVSNKVTRAYNSVASTLKI